MLTRNEFVSLTGATARQIDYWTYKGIIPYDGDAKTGMGHQRQYDPELVALVKTLVRISKAFNGFPPRGLLLKVSGRYEEGFLDLGNGVTLNWNVIEKEKVNG